MSKRQLPTERTLKYFRAHFPDAFIDKVERWIPDARRNRPGEEANARPGGGIRKDLFGIIDLVAIRDGKIVGIQCTGYTAFKAHIDKIESAPATIPWLKAGGLIEVWGFKKTKLGNVFRYTPKIVPITIPGPRPIQKELFV